MSLRLAIAPAAVLLALPASAPARTITGTAKRDVIHGGGAPTGSRAGAEPTASTAARADVQGGPRGWPV